ncbi:unnamed protein product [Lactuca virosa]|uniref:Protein kinase domain-containing protein n=1 Tax=Lactuca virosa TaxID=75947 RepID=A0AAU9LWJ2_9ASTR|nr:unnamed protein product [Lactuca virosa]
MGCFPCAGGDSSTKRSSKNKRNDTTHNDQSNTKTSDTVKVEKCNEVKKESAQDAIQSSVTNEREGGFGKVFKGKLEDSDQIVAIKQLDPDGLQGIREFVVEVLTLSMADHPNLVKLIGYCAEGEQRLLVYEYMPLGSLEDHLHDDGPHRKRLDWNTRMKIAAGAARGFGVVLLELITGRKAIDNTRSAAEQNLVAWARPLFKDRRKFSQMADPVLEGQYPVRGLYQALAIAAMCVQEQPNMRPLIADVVTALNYLASQKYDPLSNPVHQSSRRSSRTQRSIDENKPNPDM